MSTVDNSHNVGFWERVALVRFYMLRHSRHQFHYAAEVLFHSATQCFALGVAVVFLNLFGLSLTLDLELIAHFVGPLGLGALAAGHVRMAFQGPGPLRGWVVSGVFGGATVLTFMALGELRHGKLGWPVLAASPLAGAAIFMLLHWLMELEQRKSRAA